MLFEEIQDRAIFPQGLRILGKTNILKRHIISLMENFKSLGKVANASNEDLAQIFENLESLENFIREFNNIREKIIMRKDINKLI